MHHFITSIQDGLQFLNTKIFVAFGYYIEKNIYYIGINNTERNHRVP